MKVDKKVISDLTLCYCVSPLEVNGKKGFIVASEKQFPCYLFDEEGNRLEEIWSGPGGTMSAVQLPGSCGSFIATHRFYSPNDSKDATIVLAKPGKDGKWSIQTVADLPYVHRFDILERDGRYFLLACCLKSGYEYKDDWRFPGVTYACELPSDLESWDENRRLEFAPVMDNMLKNHGYSKHVKNGVETGIVACDSGCYRFWPPVKGSSKWTVEQLTDEAASDALFGDWDDDGKEEMITISPFHGDTIAIFKEIDGKLVKVWTDPEKMEFSHAICGVKVNGKPYALIGARKGKRNLVLIDGYDGNWKSTVIDEDVGSANARYLRVGNKDVVVSANREINEVAYYTLSEE